MRYSIQGDTLPVVICELDAGEKIITEGGGMAWMSPNMKMETTGGGIGKMFGRALSGDTIFQNIYTYSTFPAVRNNFNHLTTPPDAYKIRIQGCCSSGLLATWCSATTSVMFFPFSLQPASPSLHPIHNLDV